jgi:hypothetical protein
MGQQLGINEAVAAHLRAKQRAKRAYEVADAQLAAILKEAEPGDTFQLGKRKYVLSDKLAGGKIADWHGTKYTRYEIELVSEKKKKSKP